MTWKIIEVRQTDNADVFDVTVVEMDGTDLTGQTINVRHNFTTQPEADLIEKIRVEAARRAIRRDAETAKLAELQGLDLSGVPGVEVVK